MIILTIDRIISYLNYFNIPVTIDSLSLFEQSLLLIYGNMFWILLLLFWFNVSCKLLSRLINFLF